MEEENAKLKELKGCRVPSDGLTPCLGEDSEDFDDNEIPISTVYTNNPQTYDIDNEARLQ
jgi:hypothetical protein